MSHNHLREELHQIIMNYKRQQYKIVLMDKVVIQLLIFLNLQVHNHKIDGSKDQNS